MNELQRQAYLSALGIENYAPRWIFPLAPVPIACDIPVLFTEPSEAETSSPTASVLSSIFEKTSSSSAVFTPAIPDVDTLKKAPAMSKAAAILQQLEVKKAPVVQPFSLSLYRPLPGFLIVDSRNTSLALPTEVLLNNLLRGYLKAEQFNLSEEVLRWPMIENRFVSRTEDDARNELQTWLAVENELRPIKRLWLMGENAARFWLDSDENWQELCWTTQPIKNLSLKGLITPSLNQILQRPAQKCKLWFSLPE